MKWKRERRADERRGVLPVAEDWARSMYESSGWGSRWEWAEFFSSRGTWHSLIGGDGPGDGWWGADEDDGRDGGSSEEEEVGGRGRPEGWWEKKMKEERRGRRAVRQNRWQWLTVKEARLLTNIHSSSFVKLNEKFLLWKNNNASNVCDRKGLMYINPECPAPVYRGPLSSQVKACLPLTLGELELDTLERIKYSSR